MLTECLSLHIILSSLAYPATATTSRVSIIYSTNLRARLEDCGCTGLGVIGLSKRLPVIQRLKAEGPSIHVDAGDAFFKAAVLQEDERSQLELKAHYVARSLNHFALDGYALGDRDFALGDGVLLDKLLPETTFPLICSNAHAEKPLPKKLKAAHVVECAGLRVALFALTDSIPGSSWSRYGFSISDPISSLQQALADTNADLYVCLGHLKPEALKNVRGLDVLVDGSDGPALDSPTRNGDVIVVSAGQYGKYVGKLTLDVIGRGRNRRVTLVSNQLVAIDQKGPSDSKVSDIVAEYQRALTRLQLTSVPLQRTSTKPMYWLSGICGFCHPEQLKFWRTTKHSTAYVTLEKRNSAMDIECIGCHSTGFRKTGGWTHPGQADKYVNVQCEACHSPGALHKVSCNVVKPSIEVCRQCHDQEHSPAFAFDERIRKISCPK